MKSIKIKSIYICLSLVITAFVPSAFAEEQSPLFHMSANSGIALDTSNRVETWTDETSGFIFTQPDGATRRPNYLVDDPALKKTSAVHFASNRYLIADIDDYSGDFSLSFYYKQTNDTPGRTLFSSHSYTGSVVREGSSLPFTIENGANKTLVVKLPSTDDGFIEYDTTVSIDSTAPSYMGLYITYQSDRRTMNIYQRNIGDQSIISEPVSSFKLDSDVYIESIALGLCYYGTRTAGLMGDIVDVAFYDTALSLEDVNALNKYIKVTYENPVLTSMYVVDEPATLTKGATHTLSVMGVGTLMGEQSDVALENISVTSSNQSIILVSGNILRATGFGTAIITLSYPGLDDYSFAIEVPQLIINPIVTSEFNPGTTLSYSQAIENFDSTSPLSVTLICAMYRSNMLSDITILKSPPITENYTFNGELNLPLSLSDTEVYLMLLDSSTHTPLGDFTLLN